MVTAPSLGTSTIAEQWSALVVTRASMPAQARSSSLKSSAPHKDNSDTAPRADWSGADSPDEGEPSASSVASPGTGDDTAVVSAGALTSTTSGAGSVQALASTTVPTAKTVAHRARVRS